jgi:hypothetical protein
LKIVCSLSRDWFSKSTLKDERKLFVSLLRLSGYRALRSAPFFRSASPVISLIVFHVSTLPISTLGTDAEVESDMVK